MYDLHRAARYGDVSRLRELLQSGAESSSISAFDSTGLTALMHAVRGCGVEGVKLLLAAGASVHQESKKSHQVGSSVLALAASAGDPHVVAALIEAGAEVRYLRDGYDVLLDAVHGRAVSRDPQLLDLLRLLLSKGAQTNTITAHNESVLRVLSRIGRFDAVRVLLEAGADESHLAWTLLIKAVALGTLEDVEEAIGEAKSLEGRDYWERTAWLVAIQTGEVDKARFLLENGADRLAVGRCSKPSLFYAIENCRIPMLRCLLDIGIDVEQTDQFEETALMTAAQCSNLEAVELLLAHGARVDRQRPHHQTALSDCTHPEIARKLLAGGADPKELAFECRRALLGLPAEPDPELLGVSADDFYHGQARRFGSYNGEEMSEPFWHGMIRSGIDAYRAAQLFSDAERAITHPVWCAQRFGQSLTFLPDGRIIQIGGEHEDHYDEDFCIYNDVFVYWPDGAVRIYGYPEGEFPCTDFHTATLIGSQIWIVGSLNYHDERRYGETPVYLLDTQTYRIRKVETGGTAPGWISRHRADLSGEELRASGGFICSMEGGKEAYGANPAAFVLSIRTLEWRKEERK